MRSENSRKKKILFVMTIDTEEEWNWKKGFPVETYSVQNTARIPKFQTFCNELGVKPTYFIDYAIASDPASVKCFRTLFEEGVCEVGTHLHPWITPPIEEDIHDENTHAINLPPDLVRRKLQTLTQKIEHEVGKRPLSFRSGRWGINGTLLKILIEQGYVIDSSVCPFHADSTFSYYDAPDVPYWPDLDICTHEGSQNEIFEIPVTSGFSLPNFALCHRVHHFLSAPPWTTFHAIGILWNLHVMRKLQLSPELTDSSNMITLVNSCLKRGHRIIHMYLHSSSLLPGGSPYVSNDIDENTFYRNIADVVNDLKTKADVSFCTITEAKQQYLQEDNS